MIYVGIDVAKDKHDCYIKNAEGQVLAEVFTVANNQEGFDLLFQRIKSVARDLSKVKVGLEATGHYSYNILGFLLEKGLATFVLNPLHTTLFRKSLSLRKTKTDRVDARTIVAMMKSISRLVTILFPELEKLVPSLHLAAVYALLAELPGAKQVAACHLTHLSSLLEKASKGRYGKMQAKVIRDAARRSIGAAMPAKSMELKHTIRLIGELTAAIEEIEAEIKHIMDELHPPILTIPGISYRMGAMILAEIGDLSMFDSPDKLLAYAGCSPSTYQSGQLTSTHAHMEKRGSRYLRYALYNAAKYVCLWDLTFGSYLAKKRAEGKHYNVALSHVIKKLVRVIFHLQKTGQPHRPASLTTAAIPFGA